MDTLAKRVKSRRETLKLTQGKVAKLSGLKQPDISKIERGRIKQTTEILGLARALKCNPDWLESETGPMEIGHATSALTLSAPATPAQETAQVAMSAECKMIFDMFAALPDDPVLRGVVVGKFATIIAEARASPEEKQKVLKPPGDKRDAA